MTSPFDIERLRRQYADRRVTVDARRPELARFVGKPGRVAAVSWNGLALVQFEGVDACWHDIDPRFLVLEPSP